MRGLRLPGGGNHAGESAAGWVGVAPMELPTIGSLSELARLLDDDRGDGALFVRWSEDPDADLRRERSVDDLTRTELDGLSANSLAVEPWWGDRPVETWLARRIYDYLHLRARRAPLDVRPWVLAGEEVGRGPDNEPLVRCRNPVAWIGESVVDESVRRIEASPGEWGPLDRLSSEPPG
jgi:hypothetical protein